jgi:hypothetical protein
MPPGCREAGPYSLRKKDRRSPRDSVFHCSFRRVISWCCKNISTTVWIGQSDESIAFTPDSSGMIRWLSSSTLRELSSLHS